MEEDQNNGQKEQIKRVLITILSILLIIWLVFSNYTKPLDKVYSPEAFYAGKTVSDGKENPLEVYSRLTGNKNGIGKYGACDTKYDLVEYQNLLEIKQDVVLPVIKDVVKDFDANALQAWGETYSGETLGLSGNSNHWYLWHDLTDTGNAKIVSPYLTFYFRTSNFDGNDIGVGPKKDGNYLLVKDAKNWFCHASAADPVKQHSSKTGPDATDDNLKGRQSVDGRYTVIGVATKDTYIVGIKVENGIEEECSPAELFQAN